MQHKFIDLDPLSRNITDFLNVAKEKLNNSNVEIRLWAATNGVLDNLAVLAAEQQRFNDIHGRLERLVQGIKDQKLTNDQKLNELKTLKEIIGGPGGLETLVNQFSNDQKQLKDFKSSPAELKKTTNAYIAAAAQAEVLDKLMPSDEKDRINYAKSAIFIELDKQVLTASANKPHTEDATVAKFQTVYDMALAVVGARKEYGTSKGNEEKIAVFQELEKKIAGELNKIDASNPSELKKIMPAINEHINQAKKDMRKTYNAAERLKGKFSPESLVALHALEKLQVSLGTKEKYKAPSSAAAVKADPSLATRLETLAKAPELANSSRSSSPVRSQTQRSRDATPEITPPPSPGRNRG